MSEPSNLVLTPSTSVVRNTVGKGNEQTSKNPSGPASDAALREYYDKYYHQLLPIIDEKVHQKKGATRKAKGSESSSQLRRMFKKKLENSRGVATLRVQNTKRKRGTPKGMTITNPELIKHLDDNILKLVDEMMRVTVTFLRGEVEASNQTWKKSPKEILTLDKGKFKTPPPMITLVEKRNNNKFYEFHRKDQPKASKKGEASGKDKPLAILMVQPWKRVARQRITQSFSPYPKISFPPLGEEDRTEGPMII
ncbi:hypothetical protein Tco_1476634 [Tanacetum coccineum]